MENTNNTNYTAGKIDMNNVARIANTTNVNNMHITMAIKMGMNLMTPSPMNVKRVS